MTCQVFRLLPRRVLTSDFFDSNQGNLFGRAENFIGPVQINHHSAASVEKSEFYKNAQLFCTCHRCRDNHACNFVGTI